MPGVSVISKERLLLRKMLRTERRSLNRERASLLREATKRVRESLYRDLSSHGKRIRIDKNGNLVVSDPPTTKRHSLTLHVSDMVKSVPCRETGDNPRLVNYSFDVSRGVLEVSSIAPVSRSVVSRVLWEILSEWWYLRKKTDGQ